MPKKPSKNTVTPQPGAVNELLARGVDTVYPTLFALQSRLTSGDRLTVYLGVDPSGTELHIGHAIVLQKLRQFQQLGHRVILLIGDFTGQTGDPTDKQAVRQPLTKEQVTANAAKYQEQASRVLDFAGQNPAEIKYNSEWLEKLGFAEVAALAGHFTVQQMLERDMFEERLKANKPISLREFLYPLMQGYDSVALETDVEVGATDQTFNMLAGRKLAKEYLGKEKFVLTVPLLADSNGVKIGKSEGNAIAISGDPNALYGQVMSLPDEVIVDALSWCTSVPMAEVGEVAKLVKTNPRDAKMRLALAMVAEFHDASAANGAQEYFVNVFQKKEEPQDISEWKISHPGRQINTRDLLKVTGLASSASEAQRLIEQGAFRINGEVFKLVGEIIPEHGQVLQVGKKKFLRVVR